MPNFLLDFVSLNKNSEIPPIFALWSGIGGISAVLGRRVWLDQGRFTVFPNEYILLVAGSGTHRKSTAVHQIEKMVMKMEPSINIIPKAITKEAFYDAMRGSKTPDPKNLLSENATGFAFLDEMSTFLNRKSYDDGLAPILTTAWDCEPLTYRTKSRGLETLNNVCFGFLGASTIDFIRAGIPPESVGAGLTSRILFIYSEDKPKPVPRPSYSEAERELMTSLFRRLQQILTLEGEAQATPDAWTYHDEKYNSWYTSGGTLFYEDPLLAGYASRRFVHLLKLAIILAAGDLSLSGQSLLVTKQHMIQADHFLGQLEKHMKLVMSMITATDTGYDIQLVSGLIARCHQISRSDLLRTVSNRMSSRELSDVIETLIHSRQISISTNGQSIIYTWTKPNPGSGQGPPAPGPSQDQVELASQEVQSPSLYVSDILKPPTAL